MDSDKAVDNAQKAVSALTEIINLAKDDPDAKEAARNLAKSARTITQTINTCLLPLAAVNYSIESAKEYFINGGFKKDLEEVTRYITPENLIEPKASIAGPALQGMAFSIDEEELKNMYLRLIASAMDRDSANTIHPAFAEIIKQLSVDDAIFLNYLVNDTPSFIPVVDFHQTIDGKIGGITVVRDYGEYIWKAGMKNGKLYNLCIDNLLRLRLIQKIPSNHLTEGYDELIPPLLEAFSKQNEGMVKASYHPDKSFLKLTALGQQFVGSCIDKEWKESPLMFFL